MPDPIDRIVDDLLPNAVPIGDLNRYYRNPRRGDVAAVAESLSVNGQFKPIVVNRGSHTGRLNEILAGNHTHEAALQRGWEQIAVTWVDVDDEAAARIVVVDNRTSDLAGYDTALLADILSDLPDLDGTGYDQDDLDGLLDDVELPGALELTSDGAGTGEKATVDYLQWGYMQWSSTRVRITAEEVQALDALHEKFVEDTNGDLGFGWHLMQLAHKQAAA
ncbi:ParB N-terminal domain-containing protein [Kitasatospora sp. NPDC004745]|uniref:ParB N-terminal domain-containing protein n=1 Tax=Kitasatospora sp. NPDC004745 TaxID=3364019 RepID=UPI0036B8B573